MDWGDAVTIFVAIVAAASAWASQRSAAKASTLNVSTTSRVEMEKEAYERARAFDIETIKRQDDEILELRNDNRDLHEKIAVARAEAREARREVREVRTENQELQNQNAELMARISVLESSNKEH